MLRLGELIWEEVRDGWKRLCELGPFGSVRRLGEKTIERLLKLLGRKKSSSASVDYRVNYSVGDSVIGISN